MSAKSRLRKILRSIAVAGAVFGVVLGLYASTFVLSYGALFADADPLLVTDVGRVTSALVEAIYEVQDVDEMGAALADARERGLKVSIAGSRHSQGGQTYTEGGVVLSMRGFNRILAVDPVGQTITVESGATWDEVQRAIAPQGLAVRVMQSSNVFTVGGTLSANAHGRDVGVTQMVEVTERFGLMLASGEIVEVSREENPELFSLVVGGYGLYGVILDVTIRVVPDELYEQSAVSMDYREFPQYVVREIQRDPDIAMMIARPSIDPDPDEFLREMVVVTWRRDTPGIEGDFELTEEERGVISAQGYNPIIPL